MSLLATSLWVSVIFVVYLDISRLEAQANIECFDSFDAKCDFCLSAHDFDDGSYRIRQSGLYCLTDDIIFNPLSGTASNANDAGWFPLNSSAFPGSQLLDGGGFALGFFAAITIETSNVKLDLNGFKIEWHFHFYLQQRFGAIIEIGAAPFVPGQGPANFGDAALTVRNIEIRNGELGLTSHHGIHANNASNVVLKNLKIYDFEVGGIQLSGFNGAVIKNVQIGPSVQTPLSAFYSSARFVLLALQKLIETMDANDVPLPSLTFANGNLFSLTEIRHRLLEAMDLIFKYSIGSITDVERQSPLFAVALDLFLNRYGLPDGSAIYGIFLNSFGAGTQAFGGAINDGEMLGRDIRMKKVYVDGLRLRPREVLFVYFDECDDTAATQTTLQRGPFGDAVDVTLAVSAEHAQLVNSFAADLSAIRYVGNPLIDAQIALFKFGDYVDNGINFGFTSELHPKLLAWALEGAVWPSCARFICNADIMFHTNKGVVGIRMDGIEEADLHDVSVTNLENVGSFASTACGAYRGPLDGGHPGGNYNEGYMGTDVRGISVTNGDVLIDDKLTVSDLRSWRGDVEAISLMHSAVLEYASNADVKINALSAADKVDNVVVERLTEANATPFPNNFQVCSLSVNASASAEGQSDDCAFPVLNEIAFPQACASGCDAFSVFVSDSYYSGDNICISYDVQRLLSDGICGVNMQYMVLGVCSGDSALPTDVLDGLIVSVESGGTLLTGSGVVFEDSFADTLMGIRVDLRVKDVATFTVCLHDVFNSDEVFSSWSAFRRGAGVNKFVCNAAFVEGLPCMDAEKLNAYLVREYGTQQQANAEHNDETVNRDVYEAQNISNSSENGLQWVWIVFAAAMGVALIASMACLAIWCQAQKVVGLSGHVKIVDDDDGEDFEDIDVQ